MFAGKEVSRARHVADATAAHEWVAKFRGKYHAGWVTIPGARPAPVLHLLHACCCCWTRLHS